ncbi:MAG TPA: ABC transporter substrate-binding protein, partial [Acidimicrobiales bacterium]|nr:ABC transporter substrate-binding protein [Acidimicrobiales bacterium]
MRARAIALVAVGGLALAACSSSKNNTTSSTTASGSSSTSASGGALKLGFFGALTGPNAQLGINIENGEKLAVAQYNATNPSNQVTVDPFDSQGDPANANNGATKLIGD